MKFINGSAEKFINDAKQDIKSRFSSTWKSIINISAIIFFLGLVWQASGFVQTQKDTTKTVATLKDTVTELKIEKTVNDTITTEYLQELVQIIAPDKAEGIIKRLEEKREKRIAEWKRQLLDDKSKD